MGIRVTPGIQFGIQTVHRFEPDYRQRKVTVDTAESRWSHGTITRTGTADSLSGTGYRRLGPCTPLMSRVHAERARPNQTGCTYGGMYGGM